MSSPDLPGRRLVLVTLVSSAALMAVYWTLWFTARGAVASNHRPAYVEFEDAFPLADAWVTYCLLAGWWAIRRGRDVAVLWLLAGGGAGLYLFGMDVLYDLERGIWWRWGAGGVIELVINLLTLTVSAGVMRWAWRHRVELMPRRAARP
jgi:hypothetical protein